MKKLAVISTHPIQYNAPLFRLLNKRGRVSVKVFYTWSQSKEGKIYDPGFGIEKSWDIPLLDGYDYHFSENISGDPGSHHYKGVINPNLIKEILENKPDAILVYGWRFHSHLKALRYFKNRIPVYFRGDSTLIDEKRRSLVSRLARFVVLRWVYGHVDHALYTGELNKKYFKRFGVKTSQLVFMPHAIDNVRFSGPDPGMVTKYKMELNIPGNALVVLFAGKLEAKKDPELLIRAFSRLQVKDIYLVIVGNGQLEQVLKAEYAGLKNLRFLPFQNQAAMPSVYALADIFVLPSKGPEETWGLAVNEAMASGKAVIVSDKCGCHPDLVQDGKNGHVFRSGDLPDLKNKLELLLNQGKDKLYEMGRDSKRIIETWSIEHCAEILENQLTKH